VLDRGSAEEFLL